MLHGKGDKARTVGIDGDAMELVQRWLDVHSRWNVNGSHPIFCTCTGLRMDDGYIRQLFTALGRIAGIQKRRMGFGILTPRNGAAKESTSASFQSSLVIPASRRRRGIWITWRR